MQWTKPRPVWRWKSFWLGVPGLVFLLWVWVDSLKNVSVARSRVKFYGQGRYVEGSGLEMCVQQGMGLFHRSGVMDVSPEILVKKEALRFERRKGELPAWWREEAGVFHFESTVRPMELSTGRLSLKAVSCWFPLWSVVAVYGVVWIGMMAVYGVVWIGMMVVWRWWMGRRWRRVLGFEI